MRIYVDFDDCLCETARAFSKLALEMFNKNIPYDRIHYFELDRSFDQDAEQYERFMLRGTSRRYCCRLMRRRELRRP